MTSEKTNASDLRNKLKEDGVKITIQSNIKGHYSLTLNEVS